MGGNMRRGAVVAICVTKSTMKAGNKPLNCLPEGQPLVPVQYDTHSSMILTYWNESGAREE